MVGFLGEKSSYGVGLAATIAFLPAAVMFLISSSFIIANHSPTTFTVTALLAGIFIIVSGSLTFVAELIQLMTVRRGGGGTDTYQMVLAFTALQIIAGGTLLVVGGSRKIANPASLWASIVLTIGPSVLFEAFLMRKIIAQSVRVKRRSLGRFLRLVGADLYVLGAGTFTIAEATFIIGTRSAFIYGGVFGLITGGLFLGATIAMGLGLIYALLAPTPPPVLVGP